jgi:hypothetical protein
MRTSASLDSKLPRVDLDSEEKPRKLMKKSSQLISDGRSLTTIEHLRTRIQHISQIIGEIKAKSVKQ